MSTTKQNEERMEKEEDLLQQIREELTELQARIGPRFRRAEVRSRASRFLEGLLANVPRKNGWQMAEELGEDGPRGVQRLLGEADWDEESVRDDLRAYVVEHLAEADGLLVMDAHRVSQKRQEISRGSTPVQRDRWATREQEGAASFSCMRAREDMPSLIVSSIRPGRMDGGSGALP
jgi:hypothetical protein